MTKQAVYRYLKQHISLTAKVSILLVLVAIVPLLMTITISQLLTRPQLISQSTDAMEQDAHTRVQLIDAYLQNRLRDVQTISNLYSLQAYMHGNKALRPQVMKELQAGDQNDINYDSWSVLDLHGNALLWYPIPPKMHGTQLIPSDILAQIQQTDQTVFSGVFYDPDIGDASLVIYAPILGSGTQVIGIIRTEFVFNYIWNVVNSQADNTNSYGFILDQRGIRIAYTSSGGSTLARSWYLFKAVEPLSPADQRLVYSQDLYGSNEWRMDVFSDPQLARENNNANGPTRFEMVPAEQQESYEVVKVHIAVIGWNYYALRPIKAIVAIADQQLITTFLIAAAVLILAIIIGVILGRRITQPILRSLEQQQHAYEQQEYLNTLKDQILLTVSHELRTPLTEVYGYLELLQTYMGQIEPEMQCTFLKNATRGCEELQLLVNDMLDTVRADNQPKVVQLENISANQVLKDVLDLFNPRTLYNYELQVAIPETLTVRADQQYLRQILRNLISNALKYTPAHTTITIDAQCVEPSIDEWTLTPMIRICVKDSGPGIAPNDIPALFEKFVRLKRDLSSSIRGVGLGLYITKQMVEAMQGKIWVESSGIAGEGSCFCFMLPQGKSQEEPEKLPLPEQSGHPTA